MPRESMLAASAGAKRSSCSRSSGEARFTRSSLLVAVAAEEPGVPRPVAGVVAHRDQERDPRGDEVADERQQDAARRRGRARAAASRWRGRVTSGWPTKRKNAAYRLTRFHSKTAPVGMLLMMKPCSIRTKIIPTTSSGPGSGDEQQRQRRGELEERAGVRHRPCRAATAAGRPGYETNMRRRSDGALHQRVVHRHHRDDVAEGDGQLRHAGPEPDRELHRLAAGDPVLRRAGSRRSWRSGARRARRARSSCRRARRAAAGRRSARAAPRRSAGATSARRSDATNAA